jgi:hypothetical protein
LTSTGKEGRKEGKKEPNLKPCRRINNKDHGFKY